MLPCILLDILAFPNTLFSWSYIHVRASGDNSCLYVANQAVDHYWKLLILCVYSLLGVSPNWYGSFELNPCFEVCFFVSFLV